MTYHTMLDAPGAFPPIQRATFHRGVALQRDIREGLASEFGECDVLYMDLPWGERGQSVFNQRAGVAVTYEEMLAAVAELAESTAIPMFVVTGKRDAARLPLPTVRAGVVLNGTAAQALAYAWEGRIDPAITAGQLLSDLAVRYECVGDPFCGFGRSGQIFAAHRKRFAMSDYNAQCIGYIALHAARWWPADA